MANFKLGELFKHLLHATAYPQFLVLELRVYTYGHLLGRYGTIYHSGYEKHSTCTCKFAFMSDSQTIATCHLCSEIMMPILSFSQIFLLMYTATLMDMSTSIHKISMKLAQQFLDKGVIMVTHQKEYSAAFYQVELQVLCHCTVTVMIESISTPPIAMRLA